MCNKHEARLTQFLELHVKDVQIDTASLSRKIREAKKRKEV